MDQSSISRPYLHYIPVALMFVCLGLHVVQWAVYDRVLWSGSAFATYSQIDNDTSRIIKICPAQRTGLCGTVRADPRIESSMRKVAVLPTRTYSLELVQQLHEHGLLQVEFPLTLSVHALGLRRNLEASAHVLRTRQVVAHAFTSLVNDTHRDPTGGA